MRVGRASCKVMASAARSSVCTAEGIRAYDGIAVFQNLVLRGGVLARGWTGMPAIRRHG